MNRAELKTRLAQIVEANRQVKANPSVILIHLVKAIYSDESLTNDRLVQLCGLDRKTLYRNNADIKAVQSMLPPCDACQNDNSCGQDCLTHEHKKEALHIYVSIGGAQ